MQLGRGMVCVCGGGGQGEQVELQCAVQLQGGGMKERTTVGRLELCRPLSRVLSMRIMPLPRLC